MLTVNYYGEVFSTSGYATAARSYVRALHAAGVRVAVMSASRPPHRVDDALVRSLVGHAPNADFNLIHAIPSFWPRWAHTASNVVAITVWEADPIPQAWHQVLSRIVDLWVPCEFNVRAFGKALGRTPFRLPYALPNRDVRSSGPDEARLGVGPTNFVFYSIFDWQHRKNPEGMMEAFLTAFSDECDAVLVLKTTARASVEAHQMLDEVRSRTRSRGHVILRCECFDDAQIGTLHNRGDCYVSLHRGEGWGYPLFEAAAHGKPTVASAQGGPLDFLDPARHRLVPCADQSVQQPYFLFDREMRWGEPDLGIAAQALRWVYEHPAEARANADATAPTLRTSYSVGRIGDAAKARLIELLAARSQAQSA